MADNSAVKSVVDRKALMVASQDDPIPSSNTVHLIDLPYEILLKIFQSILQIELPVIARTSKKLHKLVYDPILWQELDFCNIRQHHSMTIASAPGFRRTIFKCPQLRVLRINEPWFDDDILLHTLRKLCPRLETLDIRWASATGLSADGVADAVAKTVNHELWTLRELRVTLTDIPSTFFTTLTPAIQELEILDLNHCEGTSDWEFADSFPTIANACPRLREFYIDGIQQVLSSNLVNFLSIRGRLLQRLELDGESLEDCVLHSLAKYAPDLISVKISFCQGFTNAGLASLRDLNKLENLQLKKGTSFTSIGFENLFQPSLGFTTLSVLHLIENSGLEDDGLICIANCCPQLKSLVLNWCWELTDRAIDHVVQTCTGLLKLDLTGVKRLSDASMANVVRCVPRLKILIVKSVNNVDDQVLTHIAQSLPEIIIINFYGQAVEREDLEWGSTGEVYCEGLHLKW
eukprot:m.101978 g.101978  ORF g.101978 m.101978 type:complete len:462 (-) comp27370_c0_seq2:33-1418(-)